MPTILEAEAALRGISRERSIARLRELNKVDKRGAVLSGVSAVLILAGFTLGWLSIGGRFLSNLIVVAGCLLFIGASFILMRNGAKGADTKEEDYAVEVLELAQKNWVKAQGFELPKGAYAALAFPLLPDRSGSETFGTTQLVDVAAARFVTASLRMEPTVGYVLSGADGLPLRASTHIDREHK